MHRSIFRTPSTRDGSRRQGKRTLPLWMSFFIVFVLITLLVNTFGTVTLAHAAVTSNPNPVLTAPPPSSQVVKPPDLGKYVSGHPDPTQQLISSPQLPLVPQTFSLTPAAQQISTHDKHLEVDIAAATVSAQQVQAAGGRIQFRIVQTDAGSGSSLSGHILLGTYQLSFFNSLGTALTTLVLAHPLTLRYHLAADQGSLLWQDQTVYALWNTTTPVSSTTINGNTLAPQIKTAAQNPIFLAAKKDAATLSWSTSTTLSAAVPAPQAAAKTASTPVPPSHVIAAAASSTVAFSTQAPVASWGTPQSTDVGLSSGSLDYSYPINVPAGPGGFVPDLKLNYSSGSISESHNAQATAPWVGEGWNLGLGSISWSQVTSDPDETPIRRDNVWSISDSNGISGELVPPNYSISSTDVDTTDAWHSAPESHARIMQVNFNNQPCWHVSLPTGIIEEFGCTNDSRQSATDATGSFHPYRWDLNLLVDRFGNQIRVHYQQNRPSKDVRDSTMSFIEYDDPTCHNTSYASNAVTAGCSTWNPQITIALNAKTAADHIIAGGTVCDTWSASEANRCDVPADLSGSGGLPAPKAFNDFVLNNIEIQSLGHIIHRYEFTYNQKPAYTIQDDLSGLNESVAGYLLLRKIEEWGTDSTALNAPTVNISYVGETEHYEASDSAHPAQPATNCGPAWTPHLYDGGPCWLWQQTYNKYFIQNLDNGRGWNETVNWAEAHGNTHSTGEGAGNNALTCNNYRTTDDLCAKADDRSWSRMVVYTRTAVTNGVSSTWHYQYYVNTLTAKWCQACIYGYTWGNVNDEDYADYYNGLFTSFDQVQVTQPDGSSQQDSFYSTQGWGIANSTITCYYTYGTEPPNCGVAPYWANDPGLAGRTKEVLNYGSDGKLLTAQTSNYLTLCPPPGVGHSGGAGGGKNDVGTQYLTSQLDRNNPVMVCDPRVTRTDDYQVDGVTDKAGYQSNANVLHKTTTYSYDGDDQGTSHTSGYDYGNVNSVDVSANDVNGQHYISKSTYYPNDTSSVYLTDLPGRTMTEDSAGTQYGCHVNFYGGNSSYATPPSLPDATRTEDHTGYSDPNNGCAAAGSLIVNQSTYDASGNALTAIDPDTHLGCTSGSSTYSGCAVYDSAKTHLVSASNAKAQKTTASYTNTAAGGYGQWVMSTMDVNGQSTAYQYDVLGRLKAVAAPGDTLTSPTISSTYNNTCAVGTTTPCLEMDTTTRQTVGGSQTITMKQWYDGQGNVVESKTPGPNGSLSLVTYTIYDKMGRAVTKSLPYAVSGTGYVAPDLSQARTTSTYDGLGRALSSTTYANATTIKLASTTSYTVAEGLPGFTQNTTLPFERTTTLDAYHHQAVSYSDGVGQQRYTQVFTGTASPYTVVRTLRYDRDVKGNLLATLTYDATTTQLAYQKTTFDGVGRKTGLNDSDSGSCSSTPLPAGCSSSSDTAWAYNYDNDGNLLTQQDPRGENTYMSYDALNRVLCKGTTSASVNPCGRSAYATFFYDRYDSSSNTGVTFPSGCVAPSGSSASDPIGKATATTFGSAAGSGWECSGYDQRGETDQSGLSVTADGTTTTQSIEMSYNDMGQPTTMIYPDGEALTAQYDSNGYYRSSYFGTPTSTGAVNFLVGQATYTNAGQVAGISLGGSAALTAQPTPVFSTAETYDGIQRPVSVSATRNGTTIWNQAKTYDNVGNTLSLSTTLPTISGGTQTDAQSFCYDGLDRLVWAGNTGTPSGGDHCGSTPSGTTVSTYQQPYSYDALDRLISGPAGTETYGTTPVHGANTLSTVPNQYASYDAMGNMTCRNVDTTVGSTQSCDASQTGALLSYDNEGRLSSWTAPGASTPSDEILYDNAGHRVLQRISTSGTSSTDTISFDGFTDVTINGGQTSTTKYYTANGQRVAIRTDGVVSYLFPDTLGSVSLTLYADGSTESVQLYTPYGGVRYRDGSTPTVYGFTGQRFDSLTGLMDYVARYYDPISGRFTSADSVETNASGQDPYGYVKGNPETNTDPTGHALCPMVVGCGGGGGGGGSSHPNPPPNESSPPIDTGNGGSDGGGNSGGNSGVCIWDLTCGGGTPVGASDYPAGGSSNPNPPCTASCAKRVAKVAGAALVFGIVLAAFLSGGEDGEDESGSELFTEEMENLGEACSFVAATPVATDTGKHPIGSLKVGEKVVSYNPKSKKTELEVIRHVWINHDNDLVDLTLTTKTAVTKSKPAHRSSETLHTNMKHPFLTVEKGFVPVAQLKLGMHVVEAGNRTGVVTGWKSVSGAQKMYNLEVTQDHTFIVGNDQWVAHNDCSPREQYVVDHLNDLIPNHGGDESTIKIGEGQTSGYGESLPKSQPDIETPNAIIEVTGANKDGSVPDKLSMGGRGIRQLAKFVAGANGRQVYLAYEGDTSLFSASLNRFLQSNNITVVQFNTR